MSHSLCFLYDSLVKVTIEKNSIGLVFYDRCVDSLSLELLKSTIDFTMAILVNFRYGESNRMTFTIYVFIESCLLNELTILISLIFTMKIYEEHTLRSKCSQVTCKISQELLLHIRTTKACQGTLKHRFVFYLIIQEI